MGNISKILVYGATGDQCRPVAAHLIAEGFQVRVLARDVEKAKYLAELGAEVVQGDYTDQASLNAASAGMDGVFLFVPFLTPDPAFGAAAIEAAKLAEVRLVVWNATGPIIPVDTGNPGVDVRRRIFEQLVASGLPHIVLQPTVYMENFLNPAIMAEVVANSTLAYPIPSVTQVQWITHDDVGAYVAAAFKRPELSGSVIDICGPQRLTGDGIADSFSRGLGRPVGFRAMPPKEFGAHIDAAFGPGAGDGVTAFYDAVFADPSIFSTNVEFDQTLEKLPITPTSLETWVAARRELFTAK